MTILMMTKKKTKTDIVVQDVEGVVEDPFLSSLSTLAYSHRKTTNRSSRFWFKVETTQQLVTKKKQDLAPKAIEHIDAEVEERLKTYEIELTPTLKSKIEEVREFFLTEIAPLTLASSGGTIQSKEVIQRMLDTEVDTAIIGRFDNMVNRAATLKLALFVLKYFGLPETHLNALFAHPPAKGESQQLMELIKQLPTKADMQNLPQGRI